MLHTSDFDFELSPELIASHPLHDRDASRMLVVNGNEIQDIHIRDFISFLQPGDVVVFNNSRVIPARFMAYNKIPPQAQRGEGDRAAVAGVEITLHTSVNDHDWWGLCKKFNKINIGDVLTMENGTKLKVLDKDEEEDTVNMILIKEELKRLDERDRNIIILRYFKEKTQVEVAEIYGISQVQVSRLEKRILEQMRKRIG